jgi:hypothetical protein
MTADSMDPIFFFTSGKPKSISSEINIKKDSVMERKIKRLNY